MINTKHLIKVVSAWTSIIYFICYTGVVIYPPIRDLTIKYTLHTEVVFKSDYLNIGYLFPGLIIWNIINIFGAWLFATLFNKIKR